MFKFLNRENIFLILIAILSIFFSISYSLEQTAIDGGLITSGLIKYPEGFSAIKAFYFNSWTFLHQFSAFFLKLNLSVLSVSRLILFFSTLFFFVGIYLAVKSISSSSILAFFLALTIVIFRKNFGDVDYPTVIFSVHTPGMMSLATVTFIFGLIANGNLFFAGFMSIFLICVHPVIGLWITGTFLFSIILSKTIFKNFLINKKIFYGMVLSLIPVLLSFLLYYINTIEKVPVEEDIYEIYMQHWESHRTNYGYPAQIHYEYIAKSFLLVLTCILSLKYFTEKFSNECRLMLMTVLISVLLSIPIYFIYKFNQNLFPDILISVLPTRFTLIYSVIGWPIIISFFYLLIKDFIDKKNLNPTYASICILFILFIYSVSHYKNILIRTNEFFLNLNLDGKNSQENIFWDKVRKTKTEGFVLSNSKAQYHVLRKGLKPVLYLTESTLSGIPYHPYTAGYIKQVIEDIYDTPFNTTLVGREITEDMIKNVFENRTSGNWKKISNKFDIDSIIVPTGWKIDLKLKFKSNDYAFYKFED